jgi:glutathione S-transferase
VAQFHRNEIHKQFGPLWHDETPEATKATQRAALAKRFAFIEEDAGEATVSDGRHFHDRRCVSVRRRQLVGLAEGRFDAVPCSAPVSSTVAARPTVRAAMKAERLIKEPATA